MTTIKYTKENWHEIFRQKYGMKMKDMNLNEYMLLKSIGEDIEKIVENVRANSINEVIEFIYKIEDKTDDSFFGKIASKMFIDFKNLIIELIIKNFTKHDKR